MTRRKTVNELANIYNFRAGGNDKKTVSVLVNVGGDDNSGNYFNKKR
jgi:hypothetical protein